MALDLVSTITVGSGGAATMEWTGIANTGKDLLILVSPRDTTASWTSTFRLDLNNNTGNNGRRSFGYIDAVGSGTQRYVITNAASSTTNFFSNISIYIPNYAGTTTKIATIESAGAGNTSTQYNVYQEIATFDYSITTAITSVKLYGDANFAQHSTASLYIIS